MEKKTIRNKLGNIVYEMKRSGDRSQTIKAKLLCIKRNAVDVKIWFVDNDVLFLFGVI